MKSENIRMRIAQITPGSGDNFYCENCLRDAALVTAMRRSGHDVVMIPLYLPLQETPSEAVRRAPIFFGGVNVYLQQKLGFFRKTPRWLDRLFDSPRLLQWAGRKAGMTSAKDLSQTTISMLQAENGRQRKELDRLMQWLQQPDNKPDIVCLSNLLLAGIAGAVKERLGVPVVCLLQDEDGFLDSLMTPYAEQAWDIVRQRCADIDAFIAVSNYYAEAMRKRLGLGTDTVHTVYPGLALDGYELTERGPEVPTIGFLSRMCSDKGLDILVDAFVLLKDNAQLKECRLHIAGGKTGNDEAFVERLRQQLQRAGLLDDVRFLSAFDHNAKLDFFQGLSVLAVPERRSIAFGLYALEALAAGVPVVQPANGAFGELLEITGGGALHEPNNPKALAAALEPLLVDPDYARRLGRQGRARVFERFNIDKSAQEMLRICGGLCETSKLR
jgi:glycosyltransferase involved in cell wall biosynthesis